MQQRDHRQPRIAYFTMEVGLEATLPTYAGGLGVLAGDTLRAAADLGLPMVGVTLLHRKGYFRQRLDAQGNQTELPYEWAPETSLEPLGPRVTVEIEGRSVQVRAWRYVVQGVSGGVVPVYFLDTDLPENSAQDRALTGELYGGDARYRLCQEAVLGLGGIAMLRALGHRDIAIYHMNEGHSSLIVLALLEERLGPAGLAAVREADREAVRRQCVFTTHTPVAAAHERFPLDLVQTVLGEQRTRAVVRLQPFADASFSPTHLALSCSYYVNGVSNRHKEVSCALFPDFRVESITNGVHAASWTAPAFARLYDRYCPQWRQDSLALRYAGGIPLEELRGAHAEAKRALLEEVERRTHVRLDPEAMTIGFARRATAYKRLDLIFSDLDRLRSIARDAGRLQIICGGKAHPRDEAGKAMIRRVFEAMAALRTPAQGVSVPVVYLEEYDMALAKLLCAGVDVWLNTPQKPYEASGTSGMKAALNGVPSLSVLDGWWLEGHVEGVTGWAIGDASPTESDSTRDAEALYEKLERVIVPLYYRDPLGLAEVGRSAIALNGSFFNTHRMVLQYLRHAYQAAIASTAR